MAGKKVYQVTQTTASTYIDKIGKVISGYVVWVNLLEWDESFPIQVPSLDPKLLDNEVKTLINNRKGLDNLGEVG